MRQWLRSNNASAMFRYSSWVIVCLGFFVVFMFTPWFKEIDASRSGDICLRILGGAVGVLGSPASVFLWFGMAIFCLLEEAPVSEKVIWFLLFFATASFGSAAYFFWVYRKKIQQLQGEITWPK